MNQQDAGLPDIDGPWIEILGGRTRFPRRPIRGDRLVIGAGSHCHLQLGGRMPMVHSVLSRGREGWIIEALVAEPDLKVRGETTRRTSLNDGDQIQVGPFRLVAHLPAGVEPASLPSPGPAEQPELDFPTRAGDLSAEELVDELTTELTAAVSAAAGPAGVDEIIREAIASETTPIDEEQLIADVMAQLADMAAQLTARGVDVEGAEAEVLPLVPRVEPVASPEPLRKSA